MFISERTLNKLYECDNRLANVYLKSECPTKQDCLNALISARMMIRVNLECVNHLCTERRYYNRRKRQLADTGISFILLDAKIKDLDNGIDNFHRAIAVYGWLVMLLLDDWQKAGATKEELFNLCNAHRVKDWKKEKLEHSDTEEFSKMVFVSNLDYPDDGLEWIDDKTDAPFTHATKQYFFEFVLETKEGKQAAHNAIEQVFPGLFENAMTLTTDSEGRQALIDKQGNFVQYIDGEV